jgi:hypothetical protein
MILGVWVLGGVFMTISASFSGGGFSSADGFSGGVKLALISFFPIFTFMLSAYDGSLGALLIVTIVAVIIWFVARRRQLRSPC